MFENEGVTEGGTTEASPTETEQPTESVESGENPSNTEGGSGKSQFVPYERFSEVNQKYRALEDEVSALREHITQRSQPEEQPDQTDFSDVESPQDFAQRMRQENIGRERALEARFEAKLQAKEKLSEIERDFPEIKNDVQFRGLLASEISRNGSLNIAKTAERIRGYLSAVENRGRESAKKEFMEKGAFQVRGEGNAPMRSKGDEDIISSIVGADKRSGSIF